MPEEERDYDNLEEKAPRREALSAGVKLAKEAYQARKSNSNNGDTSDKAQAVKEGAKLAANHVAGPAGGAAVEALSKTKAGKNALNAGAELLNKIPGVSKIGNDNKDRADNKTGNNKNSSLGDPGSSSDDKGSLSAGTGSNKGNKKKDSSKKETTSNSDADVEAKGKGLSPIERLTRIKHLKLKIIAVGLAVFMLVFAFILILAVEKFGPIFGSDDVDRVHVGSNNDFNLGETIFSHVADNKDEEVIYEYINEVAEKYGNKDLALRRSIGAIYTVLRDYEEDFSETKITKSDIRKMAKMVNKSLTSQISSDDEDDDDDLDDDEEDDESTEESTGESNTTVGQYEIDEKYLQKKLKKYFQKKFKKEITDTQAEVMAKEAIQNIVDYKTLVGEDKDSCETFASSADVSSGKLVRTTHYEYCSNGYDCSVSSIGNLEKYFRTGEIYYDKNNYVMIKGGTEGYGEKGKDYLIVATAHKALIGTNLGYHENSLIKYYEHGDTFSLKFDQNGGTGDTYNAIVLDQCGACMSYSTTSTDKHSPSQHPNSSTDGMDAAKRANNTKIDIMINKTGATVPDFATMMDGTTGTTCIGEIDLGELVVGTDDTKLLQGTSLRQLYGDQGITELNNMITKNVDAYGRGTGKGVAAAAITLINSLKQKGYRLPYYWAGGHEGNNVIGVDSNWGSSTHSSCSSARCYRYSSLDCSGFVSWAIRNGGCSSFGSSDTRGFNSSSYGPVISSKDAKAGDILVKDGHILLVVQNNGNDIILAESSGGSGGVHFTSYNNYSGKGAYVFRDMTNFYNSCR